MSMAPQRLRESVEGLWRELAAEQLQQARKPHRGGALEHSARARWLCSRAAEEALQECAEEQALSSQELFWLRRQVAAARHALRARAAAGRLRAAVGAASLDGGQPLSLRAELSRLAMASDALARRKLSDALEAALQRPVLRFVAEHAEARAQAEALLSEGPAAPPRPAGGLLVSLADAFTPPAPAPEPAWLADARAFLQDTQAAAEESVRHLARERSPRRPVAWHALWHGLRAPELDAPSLSAQRWRRAAAHFRALGFESHMGSRMRAEAAVGAPTPAAQVIALRVPHDVRVAQAEIDYGVLSDVASCGGVGQGLALSLALPALPVELRWPVDGGAPEALGALSMQLWGEGVYLSRVQGLHAAAAQRVGRLAAVAVLLWARLGAALASASFEGADRPERRLEVLGEAVSGALCCEVPGALSGLVGADRRVQGWARGALAGLCLHGALRERYDEDWFVNPRVGERLRVLFSGGNGMDAEELRKELRGEPAAAAARVHELLS